MIQPFICLSLLLFSSGLFAQNSDPRLEGLELEIESLMEAYKTVGVSVSIIEHGEIIYMKGFGYRNLERKKPVTPGTLFQIGSITKQFTASLLGVYESMGKLSLQGKPSEYIEGLEFYSDEMNSLVTIEDLLAHRSGIGNVDGAHVFFPTNSIDQHIKRLQYLRPNSTVRDRFDYSNMGYTILGAIGERITQRTWGENLKKDIFKPLEMNHSTTSLAEFKNATEFSWGYSVSDNRSVKVLFEDQYESIAAGGIGSNAEDMSKWAIMLLNKGKYKGAQVIPRSFLERSFSVHSIVRSDFGFDEKPDLQFDSYGYGWAVHSFKNRYKVTHSGSVSGFTSHIELYPYENLGIVVLTNQHLSGIIANISDIITNRIFNLERKKWNMYEVNVQQARMFDSSISSINRNRPPTIPFDKLEGVYSNKAYGTISISLENGILFVTLPSFKLALIHESNDKFRTKSLEEIHQNSPNFLYRFTKDNNGKVSGVMIGFQSDPVKFVKAQD